MNWKQEVAFAKQKKNDYICKSTSYMLHPAKNEKLTSYTSNIYESREEVPFRKLSVKLFKNVIVHKAV